MKTVKERKQKQPSALKKIIYGISITTLSLFVICCLLYNIGSVDFFLTFAITFGTIAYHFIMRLVVGWFFDTYMQNRADYTKGWYRIKAWEVRLYDRINVKHWKSRLPSFKPEYFDPRIHSWKEIVQAMCQAELVHEVIIVLSFAPILCSSWFGALPVFLITSIAAAIIDLTFVIIQRYNRPRVIAIVEKEKI